MTAFDADDGGKDRGSNERAWKEVRRLVREAGAVAASGGPSGKKAGVLLQKAMWRAFRITPAPPGPLSAADLRRRGCTYSEIASRLGIRVERARDIVDMSTARAHVRALRTSRASRIDRWPLERLSLLPAIELSLRNYAVVTVGHLLALDHATLQAMRLDEQAIRAVLKAVPELTEGSHRGSRKRKARAA